MSTDPDHCIEEWAALLFRPPEWDDRKAYNYCTHCSKRFTRGKQHHCRLCGHMFCSSCSSKFNIPDALKLKGKKGPVRVCMGCRQTCLLEREQTNGDVLTDRRKPFQLTEDEDLGRLLIHPPLQYLELAWLKDCGICWRRFGKKEGQHCAACGDVFCDECITNDLQVPKEFPKPPDQKKHVVCKGCRFEVYDGARFSPDPPRPYARFSGLKGLYADEEKEGDGLAFWEETAVPKLFFQEKLEHLVSGRPINVRGSLISGTSSVRHGSQRKKNLSLSLRKKDQRTSERLHISFAQESLADPQAEYLREVSAYRDDLKGSTLDGKSISRFVSDALGHIRVANKVVIRWTTERLQDYALVEVVDDESLLVLYNKLCTLRPELKDLWFCFMYKGVPIRPELWHLVEARYLGPFIYIKQGLFDFIRRQRTGIVAVALFDFEMADNASMLKLERGDKVIILEQDQGQEWGFGYSLSSKASGWFPYNRVEVLSRSEPMNNGHSLSKATSG